MHYYQELPYTLVEYCLLHISFLTLFQSYQLYPIPAKIANHIGGKRFMGVPHWWTRVSRCHIEDVVNQVLDLSVTVKNGHLSYKQASV